MLIVGQSNTIIFRVVVVFFLPESVQLKAITIVTAAVVALYT